MEQLESYGGKSRWLLLMTICAISFCIGFATTGVMVALPYIHLELHMPIVQLQWIVDAYMIAGASFIIVSGQLGDQLTRRRILYCGALLFLMTSLGIAYAQAGWHLILGRFFQGIAVALLLPNCLSLVKVNFPSSEVKIALGIWAGIFLFGFAIGPLLGGMIVTNFSWQMIFFVAPLIVIIATAILFFIPKHHVIEITQITVLDVGGFLLLTVGLMAFILGLIQGNTWGWGSGKVLTLLFSGIIILTFFCWYEKKLEKPLVNLVYFKNRNFLASFLGMGVSAGVVNILFYFFSLYAQSAELLDYSPALTGAALLPASLSMFGMSFFSAHLAQSFGCRRVVFVSCLCMFVGFFALTFLKGEPPYDELFVPMLLIGLGVGCCFSLMPALGMLALPDEKAGEASGIINTGMYLGAPIMIAITTLVYLIVTKHVAMVSAIRYAGIAGFHVAMGVGAMLSALAALLLVFLIEKE